MGLFFCSEAPGLVFSAEKNGGLPPVTSEKPHDPNIPDVGCKQLDCPRTNFNFLGVYRDSTTTMLMRKEAKWTLN
jgi:hypothetical protein